MPGAEALAALETAVVRLGPGMEPQNVAITIFSFAKLGQMPVAEAWAALWAAVARVAPRMNAQEVSNTLWVFITLAATRGVPLPACYRALWRAARGLEVGTLNDLDLANMFHAYLIHTELVGGHELEDLTFPPWIMHGGREKWIINARDNVTISSWVYHVASILTDLGVPHEAGGPLQTTFRPTLNQN
jgi:hypothetical protein